MFTCVKVKESEIGTFMVETRVGLVWGMAAGTPLMASGLSYCKHTSCAADRLEPLAARPSTTATAAPAPASQRRFLRFIGRPFLRTKRAPQPGQGRLRRQAPSRCPSAPPSVIENGAFLLTRRFRRCQCIIVNI